MSEDGGASWTALENGLPEGKKGKIGLAISPINPDTIYAAIELDRRSGGVWRSESRGASWEKMSDAVGGGTGPHYYTELYASPHKFDRIYMVSNTSQVSKMAAKHGGRSTMNTSMLMITPSPSGRTIPIISWSALMAGFTKAMTMKSHGGLSTTFGNPVL